MRRAEIDDCAQPAASIEPRVSPNNQTTHAVSNNVNGSAASPLDNILDKIAEFLSSCRGHGRITDSAPEIQAPVVGEREKVLVSHKATFRQKRDKSSVGVAE